MSTPVAIGGWIAALGVATAWRVLLARRMELVARACHELRGPLTAARLALHLAANASTPGVPRGPLEAIDLELGRAGLALADLSAAQRGARAGDRIETFALAPLLADAAGAWRATAWAKGVRLRLEAPPARRSRHTRAGAGDRPGRCRALRRTVVCRSDRLRRPPRARVADGAAAGVTHHRPGQERAA